MRAAGEMAAWAIARNISSVASMPVAEAMTEGPDMASCVVSWKSRREARCASMLAPPKQ